MGTQSDDDMTPEDLWVYKRLSDSGAKLTGYPAISIWSGRGTPVCRQNRPDQWHGQFCR